MRSQPTSGSAKVAAFAGLSAGFIGTFFVGAIVAFVGVIGYFVATLKPIQNPVQVAAAANSVGTFVSSDIPDVQPRSLTHSESSGFTVIEWTDDRLDWHWLSEEKPRSVYHWYEQNRTTRILVSSFPGWLEFNLIEFKKQLQNADLHDHQNRRKTGSEHLKWKFLGEETEISKISFEEILEAQEQIDAESNAAGAEISPAKMVLYCCIVIRDEKGYGFGFIHDPAKSNLAEEKIRAIFESYTPADEK